MALDLTSLQKAVASLRLALTVYHEKTIPPRPSDIHQVLRAGVIQNFEFTYELAWKFMRRWLESNISQTVDGSTRRELFRLARENQLIADVDRWMQYHQSRNETSHTYEETTALEIVETADVFLQDAERLLDALVKRND